MNSIAPHTHTDIKTLFEDAHRSVLLDYDSRNIEMFEAYSLIRNRAAKENIIHMTLMIAKK